MVYDRNDISRALESLRVRFGDWNPQQRSLVSVGENHLVEGKNLLGWMRTSNPLENTILDVLEEFVIRGETMGAGSGSDIAASILCTSSEPMSNSQIVDMIRKSSRYMRRSDLKSIVEKLFEEKYWELFESIIDYADPDASIVVRRENVKTIILEKQDGYVFNLDCPIATEFDERNVKCFVIDGFIESVGEIHHLLEAAADGTPHLLVARNFANDVLSTLQHNRRTGRLNVIPIKVTYDVEDLNTLVDIATIAAGDVVSSDKGDLIRSISTDSAPRIERVSYRSKKLMILNSSTSDVVGIHRKKLRERAKEADEFRRKLLEGRMLSLSGRCLKISIPNGSHHDVVETKVDEFLRVLRSVLIHGIVDSEGALRPVQAVVACQLFRSKFEKFLDSIGRAIIE